MSEEKKEQENIKTKGPDIDIFDINEIELFGDIDPVKVSDEKPPGDAPVQSNDGEIKSNDLPETSFTEDELWDPNSNVDNIPLFEEFASELTEQAEKEGERLTFEESRALEPDVDVVPAEAEHEHEATDLPVEEAPDNTSPSEKTKNISCFLWFARSFGVGFCRGVAQRFGLVCIQRQKMNSCKKRYG